MAAVFPPGANALVRWSIVGGGTFAFTAVALATGIYWSPVVTRVEAARPQPIPFSHYRHVTGNGIDCRYCHTSVETSSFAGIPPTETCLTCHSQVLSDQPMFEPLRESWRNGSPLQWNRVYDLPDFAYFNHSIHVNKGIGCSTCHGEIHKMPLTRKAVSLRMSWCVACHKDPAPHLRPLEDVYNMDWKPARNQRELGEQFIEERNIQVAQLINCSICHR